jgi:hypothetical protein
MSTDTLDVGVAQAATSNKPSPFSSPSFLRELRRHSPPIDPIARARRIRIAGAIALMGRTKCSVAAALRATGLDHDHNAREDICDTLDHRRISRIRKGVRRVRFPETPSRVFEEFIPRQDVKYISHLPPSRTLAAIVAELMAVADPLGGDVPRADRARHADRHLSDQDPQVHLGTKAAAPRPPITCAECGGAFEANRGAKFCGVACRVRHWRAGWRRIVVEGARVAGA